ncbi:MAG: hypothetical protein ACLUTK_12215 [[Clostridium] leptum]|nr:hypothetical protein [Clostridiaceae bacterium]MEE0677296.1 hypothetical protein [[Clostridium] leptum]
MIKLKILGECEMNRRSCEGCVHYKPICGKNDGIWCCHYLLDTGRQRRSNPTHCSRKSWKENFPV